MAEMFNRNNDIMRRCEILAYVLEGANYSKADLAHFYHVAEITINRDLHELRKKGISIYSKKNKLVLTSEPDKQNLVDCLSEYLLIKLHSSIIDKSIEPLSEERLLLFYRYSTMIMIAISNKQKIKMEYERLYDDKTNEYIIYPTQLIQKNLNWILQAVDENDGKEKSFHLSKVKKIVLQKSKFDLKEYIPAVPVKEKIVLKFSGEVRSQVIDKIWFDKFEIKGGLDGSIILTTEQPITNELAGWCVSWWDKLKIVSPDHFKERIKNMIDCFIETNDL